MQTHQIITGMFASFGVALVITLVLLIKSWLDFSQTGPQIEAEIRRYYRWYSIYALARLGLWVLLLLTLMAGMGVITYAAIAQLIAQLHFNIWSAGAAAISGIALTTALQFSRRLLYLPASLAASLHYRQSRLYPYWSMLTPRRLQIFQWSLLIFVLTAIALAGWKLLIAGSLLELAALWGGVAIYAILLFWAAWDAEPRPRKSAHGAGQKQPNIVMIGSDTLRADRLGAAHYRRNLTPCIDKIAQGGVQFTHCFVPCARTAPSLVSLLTGTWPHRHGIRDNFVTDEEAQLSVASLPRILQQHGYHTAAVADWCGADMAKFSFGFDQCDLPDDQWNIKYLIRQGPKDLRLLLSLFTCNRFGKTCLPELYYLGGVPLTRPTGRAARKTISQLAQTQQPFFLNIFMGATHPPFGSEYPYYTQYADPAYAGESKFVMARLTDPTDIIRRQGDSKKEFDLDQIIDLYDGCVKSFDDEVALIMRHIRACELGDNTIVVIYSDHGMEFFEHDTWGQGNSAVGDFSPRVPLIFVDPRTKSGHLVHDIVRTVDVAPTLLALLDIPAHDMDGVSLAPYLNSASADMNLAAFNETGIWISDVPGMPPDHLRYPNLLDLLEVPNKQTGTLAIKRQYRDIVVKAKDRMIRSGRWKLVYQPLQQGPVYQLFDMDNDAGCKTNVIAQHPEVAAKLQDELLAWMREGQSRGE